MPQILLQEQGDIGEINIYRRIITGPGFVSHKRLLCGVCHIMEGYRVGSRREKIGLADMNVMVVVGNVTKQ
jgi:hypothetical protein